MNDEFERFRLSCLTELPLEDVEGAKNIFMCGSLAMANRFLAILDSTLPPERKHALIRRIARECEGFQRDFAKGKETP